MWFIWFILMYLGVYHEERQSLINHEIRGRIVYLDACISTGKFNFDGHIRIIEMITQCFLLEGKYLHVIRTYISKLNKIHKIVIFFAYKRRYGVDFLICIFAMT